MNMIKQIFTTTVTAEDAEMRKEVEESINNGGISADEIKQIEEFLNAVLAVGDYMRPHYYLCAKPDQASYIKFVKLLLERVSKLSSQQASQLMNTPTFRNHKIVFERATEPRHIKGEDVPVFERQLVLLLVSIAAHLLCGEGEVEEDENANRALRIGYMLHRIEQSIIKEAA